MTELHLAAYHGDFQWLKNCLAGGLSVEDRDKHGRTPLFWAASMGLASGEREDVTAALIESGSEVNARDKDGKTILMVACSAGNDDIVRQLLEAGADVNTRTENSTALIEAAHCGVPNSVSLLLERGADIAARDNRGYTALEVALRDDWEEIIAILQPFREARVSQEVGL